MQDTAKREGALVHALHEAEVLPLEALLDCSTGTILHEGLHFSGSAFRDGEGVRGEGARYAIKVIFGPACWNVFLACIDGPSGRPALVLLIDAPQPDPPLRKRLMKTANGGVHLPCVVFGFTQRVEPGWIGRFVSHLSARGHLVSSLYLGADLKADDDPAS